MSDDAIVKEVEAWLANNTGKYEQIGKEIGKLVDEKNKAYGDSFHKCGGFLKLLYPDGVSPDQYEDMLALVRIFDKQMRIATQKEAFGENPFKDIGGYAILKSGE
jgi:hypothetical protein